MPFSSETTERNSTELDSNQDPNVLYQVCIWPIEKQDGHQSLWLAETFSTSPLKPLNVIQRNLTGSKIPASSTKFMGFFCRSEKEDDRPGSDWLRHLEPLYGIQQTWQKARSKRPLPSFCVLGRSEIAALPNPSKNGTLYSGGRHVTFGPIVLPQNGRPASDWLRYFRLLIWNHCTVFNGTWQEARSQRSLPSLCFSIGPIEKQDGRQSIWLAETFSTSPLKLLNSIQRNLTGRKILWSSTKFVFSGPMSNRNSRPAQSVKKYGTLYSGARHATFGPIVLLLEIHFLILEKKISNDKD